MMDGILTGVKVLMNIKDTLTDNFIRMYSPNMTVDSISPSGLFVKDINGKTVGIITGEIRNDLIHCKIPYAEANAVGLTNGLFLGWARKDKFIDAGDRALIRVDALNPMPDTFVFSEGCPHLSVYGGFFDREANVWRCFGCDQTLVFAER